MDREMYAVGARDSCLCLALPDRSQITTSSTILCFFDFVDTPHVIGSSSSPGKGFRNSGSFLFSTAWDVVYWLFLACENSFHPQKIHAQATNSRRSSSAGSEGARGTVVTVQYSKRWWSPISYRRLPYSHVPDFCARDLMSSLVVRYIPKPPSQFS